MPYGKTIALVLIALLGFIPPAEVQAQPENVATVQLTLVRTGPSLTEQLASAVLPQELVPDGAQELDYFMTANAPELAAITGSGKWQAIPMDGQIFVYDRWVEGTVPLYRFVHPKWGQHFFTLDRAEAQNAVSSYGYNPEGICCYISPSATSETVPLYRLRRTVGTQVHRYVTNEYERARLVQSGIWVFEGIAGFVWAKPATAALHAGSLEPLCFNGSLSAIQSAQSAALARSGGAAANVNGQSGTNCVP